jgi:3-dehydroquinate synthase
MQTLTVQLGERTYPIHIGSGLLRHGALLRAAAGKRDILLVSNVTVAPLYAGLVKSALAGNRIIEVVLPDGEQHKSLATASRVFDVMIANRLGRDAVVVAVNHPGGKNMIGAFHQPIAVIADTDLLATLPGRELNAGLAEVIKYGLICDAGFFAWLEQNIDALLTRDAAALQRAIYRSCEIKAGIVGRDEREQGDRALLNFGHTFGHAIESATGYVDWLHGEAVATGMLIAADMSARLQHLAAADVERIRRLLLRAGLPVAAPQIGADSALGYMRIDKKVKAGRVRLVLLERIGHAVLTGSYPDAALDATLRARFG